MAYPRHPKSDEIASRVAAGERPHDVAKALRIAPSTVYKVCQRAGIDYRLDPAVPPYRLAYRWRVGATKQLAALTVEQIESMFRRHPKAADIMAAMLADLAAYRAILEEEALCRTQPPYFSSRRAGENESPTGTSLGLSEKSSATTGLPIFKSRRGSGSATF